MEYNISPPPPLNNPHPAPIAKKLDGDFVVMEAVAFFKEHVTRDGVRIDRAALQRICDRCNLRINDTGDYPPVVLRHTTDDGARDPEVVGFAGPFYLGTIGKLRPQAAILGTLRIFAEDAERVKKYPRLSVEYWASEDDPTNGYFDPISLLGAETPELDLGIRYSHGEAGKRPLRYQRVVRFLPTSQQRSTNQSHILPITIHDKENPGMALDQSDIDRIALALKPIITSAVKEQFALQCSGDDESNDDDDFANSTTNVAEADDNPTGDGTTLHDSNLLDPDDETRSAAFTPTQYAKIARERNELRTKYYKVLADQRQLQDENASLQITLDSERTARQQAVRYQKLSSLQSQGFVLEVAEEIRDCQNLDDHGFERHCEKIVSKYQRIPGGSIPIEPPQRYDGNASTSTRATKSAKYAKIASENVLKAREKGIAIEFKDELDRLLADDPVA